MSDDPAGISFIEHAPVENQHQPIGDGPKPCPECGQNEYILDCVKQEARCINCGWIDPQIKVEVKPATENEMATITVIWENATDAPPNRD